MANALSRSVPSKCRYIMNKVRKARLSCPDLGVVHLRGFHSGGCPSVESGEMGRLIQVTWILSSELTENPITGSRLTQRVASR
jgi:hypothetical protein